MGKVKKPVSASKEEGQKKISNFFQKSSDKPKPKSLFTEHQPLTAKHDSSNLIIVPDNLADFKPRTFIELGKDFDCTDKREGTLHKPEIVKAVNKLSRVIPRTFAKTSGTQSSVTCIPETQLCFTPPGTKVLNAKKTDSDEVNDCDFIPDTPQEKKEATGKVMLAKRHFGRSFLLSAVQLGTNPIQKAKEHREAKLAMKRKVSQARTGLLSVSVQFTASEKKSSTKTEQVIPDSFDGDVGGHERNDIHVESHVGELSNKVDVTTDGKTPTKVYSDGSTMKRMAKSGASPDSKRITNDDTEKPDNNGDSLDAIKRQLSFQGNTCLKDLQCANVSEVMPGQPNSSMETKITVENSETKLRKERKKQREEERKLKENEIVVEKKLVAREENKRKNEKLMQYQLTGTTENSDKFEAIISLTHDDALDDILQELASPSKAKPSSKQTVHPSATKNNVEIPKTKPMKKRTVDKTIKCYGHADNVGKVHDSDTSKTEHESPCNTIDVDDWTTEDDEYFSKLGLDTGTKSDSKETVRKCEDTGTKSDSKETARKCEDRDNADDIENYLTPCSHATERSRTPIHDMDIEDFVTQQLGSNLLCEQLQGLSPFKHTRDGGATSLIQTEAPCSKYGRHVVTKVEPSSDKQQIMLRLCSQPGDVQRTCVLHGFWLDSNIVEGDTVHIIAEFLDGVCHMTDQSGLLVVNPDLLLSGTTIVSAVFCMRKSILKEKFKVRIVLIGYCGMCGSWHGCDSRNIQMLYGSIIHSVFQQVLRKELCTPESIIEESRTILRQLTNLLEMYANNVTEDKVMEEIKSYIPQMMSWLGQYTKFGVHSSVKKPSDCDVQLTSICDIEENMWSPRYGIKGKIDLTVEARLTNEPGTTVLPLELKTGKPSYSVEHKGQVTLYSMMCGDRRKDPKKGLLLYLKEPSMKIIPAEHIHQKGLIQLRNEMAYYISRQVIKTADDSGSKTFTLGRLPDPITNIRACQKCPQLINCSIYQRQVEGKSHDASGMSGLVNETLGHLTLDHMTYFIQWCLMLDLESQLDQSKKTVADIWCKSSIQREESGLCLGGMTLLPDSCEDIGPDTVLLTFYRHAQHEKQTSLSRVGVSVQDSIVISRERPAWIAVCTGFVHEVASSSIQILTERDSVDRLLRLKDSTFRIDKCDNFSTAGILYTNVSKLMMDQPHSNKLRRLIIDRVKPEFINTLSKKNIEKVKTVFKTLNKPQKTAILKVLMCKDYVLIRGYPGTGKTSTIVALVKVLQELGLSVLLTSYTHSAVDNILIKLKKEDVKFVRIGRVSKVHRDIRSCTMEIMAEGITSTSELEHFFMSQQIVATSCLGMKHPVFTQRKFDVCIVDEASQVLQPACLGPLFNCKKFVLVGDPRQLPPVVQSKESRELGMDDSLFCRLDGLGATYNLDMQYRMNSEIMAVCNTLVYDGGLKCGNDLVANQTLHIPESEITRGIITDQSWMSGVFDSSLRKSVIVLDTQKLTASHTRINTGGYRNEIEAIIVEQIVVNFCKAGIECSDIGVIAPYRSQVLHIRDRLGHGHLGLGVEVNTVDQYQGRDKNIIIISFVMSSTTNTGKVGELLQDIRRLNVAVTRAKKKLIIIGNTVTLCQYTHMKQLLHHLGNHITILHSISTHT